MLLPIAESLAGHEIRFFTCSLLYFYMLINFNSHFRFIIRKCSEMFFHRENVFFARNFILYLGEMVHSKYHGT